MDRIRLAPVLAILAMAHLAGFTPNTPISSNEISQLLMRNLAKYCDQQVISIRAGAVGKAEAQRALDWFTKTILADRNFLQTSQSSESFGRHGGLSYQDSGDIFDVVWSQIELPGIDIRDRLTVRACIYVPDQIETIDSSFSDDGTNGRILFRERMRLSLFGQRPRDAGFLRQNGPHEDFEYVAELDKDISGHWAVRSTNIK